MNIRVFTLLTIFMCSACMEDSLIHPDDRPSSIVGVVGAALEEDCPNGGVVIGYGIDSNFNGTLDADEVDGVETICHGQDGVLGVDGEDGAPGTDGVDGANGEDGAPGTDGADGDDGQDGTDGMDGANGDDGLTALVVTSQELPGDNCVNGGIRIDAGVDLNEDGVLTTDEVTQTEYICNGQDGSPGTNGLDGQDGADGVDGEDGTNGADGANGEDGEDGQDGADGENGTNGADGQDGADADPCTVENNNDGTSTITCPDGSSITVTDGTDGAAGAPSLVHRHRPLNGATDLNNLHCCICVI